MINELKNLKIQARSVEELIALHFSATGLMHTYTAFGAAVPSWLSDALDILSGAIKSQLRDEMVNKLQSARARLEALKTPGEKREELNREIEALTAKLGA